ncbi:hypothetical protein PYCC9005_001340 [Savitreella phatthalungensis]
MTIRCTAKRNKSGVSPGSKAQAAVVAVIGVAPVTGDRSFGAWLNDVLPVNSLVHFLVLTGFVTGIIDGTTYQDFKVFASNQTGNVIFLGIEAVDRGNMKSPLAAGVSVAAFVATALVFGQCADKIDKVCGGRRRWWVLMSNVWQAVLLWLLVGLGYSGVMPIAGGRYGWAYILLLASSSGAQVAMARQFSIAEIPTAMVTSPLVDLLVDPWLFHASVSCNRVVGRNRRATYIISLFVGVIIGASIHRYYTSKPVLLLASILKTLIAIGFALVPPKQSQEDETHIDIRRGMSHESERVHRVSTV